MEGRLEEIWVHVPESVQVPTGGNEAQTDSHAAAIQDILRSVQGHDNVLTAGKGMWPNRAALLVQSRAWEAVHARIGTEMLRFLLIHCTVIHRGIQVSGPRPASMPKQCPSTIYHNDRYLKRAGFEPEHILLQPSTTAGLLCRDIFDISTERGVNIPKRYKRLIPGLQKVLERVVRVPYGKLLAALCPDTGAGQETPREYVISFVWNCIRKLLPKRLVFGSKSNVWLLREWLKRTLPPCSNSEEQCPWATAGVPWLPRHSRQSHQEMLSKWSRWMRKRLGET